MRHVTEYAPAKTGEYREYTQGDIPQFSNFTIYTRAFSFHPE